MLRTTERKRDKLDFAFATINIILLLLFFFVVSGSIMGVNETGVVPPVIAQAPPERLPRPLLVIDMNGALFLDDTLVAADEIAGRLRTANNGALPPLNVVADRDFSAERFLDIVEAVRRQGVAVRIVTLGAEPAAR
jgi:biopolymer transport protein ExbD